MNQHSAPAKHCTSGVPQGSVLEPLFIVDVISGHGMLFHQYAGDIRLYVAAKAKVDTAEALKTVTSCTHAVQSWVLLDHLLRLNPDNSEVVVIGTRAQVKA